MTCRTTMIAARAFMPALAVLAFSISPVLAQGTGRSMDIDLSIRSAGMGGASNALSWGDLDHWGNPALLGYAQGVRYVHTHTALVPGLATDVFLNSDVVQVGGGGVGCVFSGRPFDRGGVRLEYGQSEGTDSSGNATGTYQSFETVKSFGAGISLVRAIESAIRLRGGHDPQLSRYADVSAGMTWKEVTIALPPSALLGRGSTTARDEGVHVRITPINGFDSGMPLPVRVDLAYGLSVLSYNDDAVVRFPNEPSPIPVTRHHRRGGAARIAAGRIVLPEGRTAGTLRRALVEGMAPLVAFSGAVDIADLGAGSQIDYKTNGWGIELTFANVVTIRQGHYQDRTGGIDDETSGWGVGLPLGDLGGVRYDDAHIPQAADAGLPRVHRSQFTAWVDPFAIRRAMRRAD